MKKLLGAFALSAVLLLTACSRSISMDKIKGSWVGEVDGTAVTIEITDDRFIQSAGGQSGEPLKFERNSDGLTVKNTDGRALIRLIYNEQDGTVSYTVISADGTDYTLTFTRSAE